MNQHEYTYADTINGDFNGCWVNRGTVTMPELTHYGYTGSTDGSYARAIRAYNRELVKRVKARIGLSGVACRRDELGGTIELVPRGTSTKVWID